MVNLSPAVLALIFFSAHWIRKSTPPSTTQRRLRCWAHWALWMGLCPSSPDGSSCLGIRIPLPWLRICPLLSESFLGECLQMAGNHVQVLKTDHLSADYHCRPWIPKLASSAVSQMNEMTAWLLTVFYRMTVPPNSLAAISIWLTVWWSSRIDRRAPLIIGSAGVAIIGGSELGLNAKEQFSTLDVV